MGRAAGDVPLRDLREAPQLPRRRGRGREEARARGRGGPPRGLGRRTHVHVRAPEGLPVLAPVERGGDGRVVPARARTRHRAREALRRRASTSTDEHRRRTGVLRGQGSARHGLSPEGDKLVIRLREPAPDLPWLVAARAAPSRSTLRSSRAASRSPSRRQGPYYLAALTDSVAVLKRNPNYGGSRPSTSTRSSSSSTCRRPRRRRESRTARSTTSSSPSNPTLVPDSQAARVAGDRYRLTPYNRIQYFAFNYDRPLFADVGMRRAVQYALDRRALVEAIPSGSGGLPATRLLYPSILGYDEKQLYPLRSELRTARRLAAGRAGESSSVAHGSETGSTQRLSTEPSASSSRPSVSACR